MDTGNRGLHGGNGGLYRIIYDLMPIEGRKVTHGCARINNQYILDVVEDVKETMAKKHRIGMEFTHFPDRRKKVNSAFGRPNTMYDRPRSDNGGF